MKKLCLFLIIIVTVFLVGCGSGCKGIVSKEKFYKNMLSSLDDGVALIITDYTLRTKTEYGETEFVIDQGKVFYEKVNNKLIYVIEGNYSYNIYKEDEIINTENFSGTIYIEDDIVYLSGEKIYENNIAGLGGKVYLKGNIDTIEGKKLVHNLNDYQKIKEIKDYLFLASFTSNSSDFDEKRVENFFEKIFTVEKEENGYRYVLKEEWIDEFKTNLDEKSISELIDTYFGNGTYEEVVKEFLDIYNTKISSLIKKNDISIEELCEFLDHYAEAITGKKGQTFESLFKISFDIEKKLNDNKNATLAELIAQERNKSAAKILTDLKEKFEKIANKKIYELGSESSENIKEAIDKIFDSFNEYSFSFTVNKKGEIKNVYNEQNNKTTLNYECERIKDSSKKYLKIKKEVDDKLDSLSKEFYGNLVNGKIRNAFANEKFEIINDDNGKVKVLMTREKTIDSGIMELPNSSEDSYSQLLKYEIEEKRFNLDENFNLAYVRSDCGDWIEMKFEVNGSYRKVTNTFHNRYDEFYNKTIERGSESIGDRSNFSSISIFYNPKTKEYSSFFTENMHEFVLEETKDLKAANCHEKINHTYKCKNCDLEMTKLKTVDHSEEYEYTFNFLTEEKNCERGVEVTETCSKCKEKVFEGNRYTHTWHEYKRFEVAIDECMYSKSHGIIYKKCGCEKVSIQTIGELKQIIGINEDGVFYYKYYCEGCDFYIVENYIVTHENDSCRYDTKIIVKIYFKNELIYVGEENRFRSIVKHDYEASYKLKDGASTCLDGVEIFDKCKNCESIRNLNISYEHYFLESKHSLEPLGCEHGYYIKYECICSNKVTKPAKIYVQNPVFDGGRRYNQTDREEHFYYCRECGFRYIEVRGETQYPNQVVYEYGCDENWRNGRVLK